MTRQQMQDEINRTPIAYIWLGIQLFKNLKRTDGDLEATMKKVQENMQEYVSNG